MAALTEAKQEVVNLLKAALGKSYSPSADELETPPDSHMGDLAFPCFTLAKGLRRPPHEIAVEVVSRIEPKGVVREVEARGPYINFYFDVGHFADRVLAEIAEQAEIYGTSTVGKGRTIVVEYAQPNTHKEIHVGHVRNFCLGHAVVNTRKAIGEDVIPVCYIGDLGMQVAKCLWGMKKFHDREAVTKTMRTNLLGRAYAEAERALAAEPGLKEQVATLYKDLELGQGPFVSLWKRTRAWSMDEMRTVFKEWSLPIDAWHFESELMPAAHRIIRDLVKKGIAVKSDGALIVDLTSENLGVNLLVRSDGTLLYNAKDLALAFKKEAAYHPDRSVYIVDARQSLALQQLFATLKRMGVKKELEHLAYEFVTLKEGAMSSRKGNIIRYQDFRDAMLMLARTETRARHGDWSEKKVEKVARAIAFAAMRFGMLRQDPAKKIIFDMDEAMSFDGFTGPYLLYTLARMKSIQRKAKRRKADRQGALLSEPSERSLVSLLALYPCIVSTAGQDYRVDRLAQYLFDLSKSFSTFYDEVPVLKADKPELVGARLALVSAATQVLENGLALLGMPSITEM
jgi:arginyl-tRNA synthetase